MNKQRLILDAAMRDPRFRSQLNALDAAYSGAAPNDELGCGPELGAFGGVADIPSGLWAQQQWAARAPDLIPIASHNLIRVNLPLQFARDWTIQLSAPAVPSGAPFAVASTFNAKVRITWGHHGATESIVCDWPQMGGSLTVHGSYVQVDVTDTVLPRSATYSAWLSEGSAARAGLPPFQPVYTDFIDDIAVETSTQPIVLQPRCRAWSLTSFAQPFALNALVLGVTFLDNLVGRARYFVYPDNNNAVIASGGSSLAQIAHPRPIPIHSNLVVLTNLGPDPWVNTTFNQWLDVGS